MPPCGMRLSTRERIPVQSITDWTPQPPFALSGTSSRSQKLSGKSRPPVKTPDCHARVSLRAGTSGGAWQPDQVQTRDSSPDQFWKHDRVSGDDRESGIIPNLLMEIGVYFLILKYDQKRSPR